MSVPDPIEITRTLLLADSGVSALAGTRVFGGELPEGENVDMPQAAVVVVPAGGPGRPGVTLYRHTRLLTFCYGATLNQAWQLHLAVREALETMTRDGALLALEMSSDGILDRDSLKQWPICVATYRVLSVTHT